MRDRLGDITINNKNNLDVRILSHKDFVPLEDEIIHSKKINKRKRFIIVLLLIVSSLFFFVLMSHLFSKATIFIEKETVPFKFSNTVITAGQSIESKLPFTVVEVTDTYHEQVVPDVLNASAQKATGSVVVYNTYTKSKINFKKGTVFLTSNNNIKFVSDNSFVLPGYTMDANKQVIPGQVVVKIVAQKTGPEYNIGDADLTISNYQNRKDKIFARTVETISGGTNQMAFGLSDELKKNIAERIDTDLKRSLYIKAEAEIPSDYILYEGMMIYTPKSLVTTGTPQTLDISREATLIAYVLKKEDVQRNIKDRLQIKEPSSPQYLGINELSVKLITEPKNLKNPEILDLNFTGEGKVVSYINTTDVSKKLKGLKISEAKELINNLDGIKNYTLTIKPGFLWLMPKNSSKIKFIDVNAN